jgi:hypothetical protein
MGRVRVRGAQACTYNVLDHLDLPVIKVIMMPLAIGVHLSGGGMGWVESLAQHQ